MSEADNQDRDAGAPYDKNSPDERSTGETLTTAAIADAGQTAQAPVEPRAFDTAGDVRPEAAAPPGEDAAPVFPAAEADDLRRSWDSIQAGFVDEPRKAVEDADHLVATTMQRLAEVFAAERATLEGQWDRGDDVSTEDLRVALRRYRAFFGRLLSA
jgi:hypothetical protein